MVMANRIRVGVLIFKDDKILLVRHVNPKDNYEFYVPPGGGLKDDETLFDCAVRETWEETGLRIKPSHIVYLRQFIFKEFNENNIDIYLVAEIVSGSLTTKNMHGKGNDEHFIKDLKFFDNKEIQKINVFPKILQHDMWIDRAKGFQTMKFIGVEHDKE